MKIRSGFVSNSSSSSFVIIGKKLENTDLKTEMLKRAPEAVKQWLSEQTVNEHYDRKELHEDNVTECWWCIDDKVEDLVISDDDELMIFEGIKFDIGDGSTEYQEIESKYLKDGYKIYIGSEMI